MNFGPALVCHFFLSLPAAFTQPDQSLFAEPCTTDKQDVSLTQPEGATCRAARASRASAYLFGITAAIRSTLSDLRWPCRRLFAETRSLATRPQLKAKDISKEREIPFPPSFQWHVYGPLSLWVSAQLTRLPTYLWHPVVFVLW